MKSINRNKIFLFVHASIRVCVSLSTFHIDEGYMKKGKKINFINMLKFTLSLLIMFVKFFMYVFKIISTKKWKQLIIYENNSTKLIL